MEKMQMQTTIHNLNEQLKVMKLEIQKLKLNQKPSEITSQEQISDDGDLADGMKWVQVQKSMRKGKLAEIKSLKQSTENKDKASSTASHLQIKQLYKLPPIMITGVENHEELTSIIKETFVTNIIKLN
jgi:hypothetical protein